MFTQTQEFADNGNQLATARTWLRVYGDYKMSEQFRFWIAIQGIDEPWYTVEHGANSSRTVYTSPVLHGGKEYSEYNNINDVLREGYVEWRPAAEQHQVGSADRHVGGSHDRRVGDVIHPDDGRFSFAFSNLEDTRIPQ